ncbi:hypothetical protein AAY473_028033 [Plecturocebus cupreus]
MLPLALLRSQCTPGPTSYSPFEILLEAPPLVNKPIQYIPSSLGPGLGERLEKGTPLTCLDRAPYRNPCHPNGSESCRSRSVGTLFQSQEGPPEHIAGLVVCTSDSQHPVKIILCLAES